MSNPKPRTDQLPKIKGFWKDAEGNTVETKAIKIPVYLEDKIKAYAQQLHAEEMAKQKAEQY
ncbi:MAG: hypothetical protein KME30_32750 [Iphinoe sp. HA4291-MV1]|jgi:hypothetical protein|nr:hypothetical protein [Iphinoe sp. HA4291-MV1]